MIVNNKRWSPKLEYFEGYFKIQWSSKRAINIPLKVDDGRFEKEKEMSSFYKEEKGMLFDWFSHEPCRNCSEKEPWNVGGYNLSSRHTPLSLPTQNL